MDLIIRMNLRDQPTAKEVASALYMLSASIDEQYLEDLQYVANSTTLQEIPITVSVEGPHDWNDE